EPAVDHDTHALDRQARFGDRGCQHNLARPARAGEDGAILLVRREVAEEGSDVNGRVVHELLEPSLHATDLRYTGQENEDVAGLVAQRAHDRIDDATHAAR